VTLLERNLNLSQAAGNLEEMLYGIHRQATQKPLTLSQLEDVKYEMERMTKALDGYPVLEGDL